MKVIYLCFLLIWTNLAWSSEGVSKGEEVPQKVTLGIYLMSISKLDFVKKTYKLSSYVWWLHKDPTYKPENSVEITNAEQYTYDKPVTDKVGDQTRTQAHIHGTMENDWQLSNYPFDRQTLHFKFEDSLFDASRLQFDVDTKNSGIHPHVKIDGWQVSDFRLSLNGNTYDTNFGDPGAKRATFSQVDVALDIKREGWSLFISSYLGFFLGFLLAIGGYFISVENLIARNNLLLGSIFSTMGNKYYLENSVTKATTFSLTDAVEDSTFIVVFLFLGMNIFCNRLVTQGRGEMAQRINKIGQYGSVIGFFIVVGTRLLIAIFS